MKKCILKGIIICMLTVCSGWSAISQSGAEFKPFGNLPGHQQNPDIVIGSQGGFAVWQYSSQESKGERVVFHRLNNLLEGEGRPVRLTADTKRTDEIFPRVAMMPGGGAVVAWESGERRARDVYIRFINAYGQYVTSVQKVNRFKRDDQTKPDVAVNDDGDVLVTWESDGQDGAGKGVYAQRYTSLGIRIGGEIAVNQKIKWNQSTPTVAALADGRFVIAWMCEVDQGKTSVGTPFMRGQIIGRIYDRQGNAVGDEFQIDGGKVLCSRPRLVALGDGGFISGWVQRDEKIMSNRLDIYVRSFNKDGLPLGQSKRQNNYTKEVQQNVAIANAGGEVLMTWDCGTSDGGSSEVHGRLVSGGAEFRVNTQVNNQQRMASASGDGNGRAMVLWVDVVNEKNTTIAGQRFVTNGGGVDLAAGESVTQGGIGLNQMSLVSKVDVTLETPGGQLKQQRDYLKMEAITADERAIQEASQIARDAAAKSAETTLINEAIRMSAQGSETTSSENSNMISPPVMGTRQSNGRTDERAMLLSTRPTAVRRLRAYGMNRNTSRGAARRTVRSSPYSLPENSRTSMAAEATLKQFAQMVTRQNTSGASGSNTRSRRASASSAIERARFMGVNRGADNRDASYKQGRINRTSITDPSSAISRAQFSGVERVANNSTAKTSANGQTAQQAMKEYARRRVEMASSRSFSMGPLTGGSRKGNSDGIGSIGRRVPAGVSMASQRAEAIRNGARDRANQANAMRSIPVPATLDQAGEGMNVRFNSQVGKRYVVQTSSDRTNWKNYGRVQRGTGNPMVMSVDAKSGQRFIRVVPTN